METPDCHSAGKASAERKNTATTPSVYSLKLPYSSAVITTTSLEAITEPLATPNRDSKRHHRAEPTKAAATAPDYSKELPSPSADSPLHYNAFVADQDYCETPVPESFAATPMPESVRATPEPVQAPPQKSIEQQHTTSASAISAASTRRAPTPLMVEAVILAHRLLPMLPHGQCIVCLRTEPGHAPYTDEMRWVIDAEIKKHRPAGQKSFILLPHEYDKLDSDILAKYPGPRTPGSQWRGEGQNFCGHAL